MDSATIKQQFYRELLAQADGLLSEPNYIASAANLSALIYQQVPGLNWAGFYFRHGDELVLGPFQGQIACVRIPLAKGVCGAAASTAKTQRVENVHQFPGHIACDSASNSELVVPISQGGEVVAVLDIDSPLFDRFDEWDQQGLEALAKLYAERCQVPR